MYFNSSNNTLFYWTGSAWNSATPTTLDSLTDTNLTSVADGAMLLYDTGTSKWIDNIMSGDATMADTGAITIGNDKIDSQHYVAASIDNEHLADNAVGTDEIADDAVTYAKMQNVSATDRILGRDSASAGVIEEITPANLRTMINVADGSNAYVHPNHTGEVTSTSDGSTVLADNVVDEANLKVSNTPTNGYMLTAQSGNTGGLTWAEAGGGKVLQVVSVTKTDTASTTSVSLANVSGLSVAITPSATSSKIMVISTTALSSTANGYPIVGLRRGSTDIGLGASASPRRSAIGSVGTPYDGGDSLYTTTMSFLDSPSSTSETTYHVTLGVRSGKTATINSTSNDTGSEYSVRGSSTITVMEIGA